MDEKSDQMSVELEPQESPRSEDTFSPQSVSEEEASMGTNATRLFMNEKYQDCLAILQELALKRPNDPRVMTNLAVCQYLSSGDYTRTDELTQSLFKTYQMLIESYGGEFEADQAQEYCVLLYNLALTRLDVKNFASAEQFMSLLYCNSSPKSQTNSDISFTLDQIQPLLIALNLYLKNSHKALTLIGKSEQKIKQESDPAAQQTLFLCHALALVQSKAFKSFKRDLKPNGLSTVNQITYEFLRANLEFAKGNARKAMKLLGIGIQQVISAQMDESWIHYINSLYQNNLGCLHLLMKKPNLGVYYTSQASDSHAQALAKMNKATPHFLLKMKRNEIMYNTAMNLLHAGQPAMAFNTLLEVFTSFSTSSSYWLRLGECCINQARKDEEVVSKLYNNPPWIHAKKVVVQADVTYPICSLEKSVAQLMGVKNVTPTLSLEFATFCLNCAEKLIANSKSESKISSSTPTSASSSPTKTSNLLARSHLTLLSIWSNLSYIYLCQGDVQAALENAEKVLQSNANLTPPGYKFLAHLYAAEAHMRLGHSNDALVLLDPKKVPSFSDVSFSDLPVVTPNEGDPSSPNEQQFIAKVMFQINLAVAYINREEIDRAEDILERVALLAPPPHELSCKILSLRLYLCLSKGNVEKARETATKYFEDKLKEIQ